MRRGLRPVPPAQVLDVEALVVGEERRAQRILDEQPVEAAVDEPVSDDLLERACAPALNRQDRKPARGVRARSRSGGRRLVGAPPGASVECMRSERGEGLDRNPPRAAYVCLGSVYRRHWGRALVAATSQRVQRGNAGALGDHHRERRKPTATETRLVR
jgi:hypothetical protein